MLRSFNVTVSNSQPDSSYHGKNLFNGTVGWKYANNRYLRTSMRISVYILLTLLFFSCKKNSDTSGSPEPNEVWFVYKNFRPQQLKIAAGTRIIFMNKDNSSHTASGNATSFYSGKLKPGQNYEYTFDIPGFYNVYCNFHSNSNSEQCVIEVF